MKYNNRTGCQVLCQIGDTPSPPLQSSHGNGVNWWDNDTIFFNVELGGGQFPFLGNMNKIIGDQTTTQWSGHDPNEPDTILSLTLQGRKAYLTIRNPQYTGYWINNSLDCIPCCTCSGDKLALTLSLDSGSTSGLPSKVYVTLCTNESICDSIPPSPPSPPSQPSPPCQKNKYRLYIFTDSECTQLYDYTKNSVGIDEFVYIVEQDGTQTEHQIKTDGKNWLRSDGSVMIAVDTACNQINDDNLYAHTVMEC